MNRDFRSAQKLVISPHVDDEVLGCGGILDDRSFVYYCGIDESRVAPDAEHRLPLNARLRELQATADFLGFSHEVNQNSRVNFFVEQEIKDELERIVNQIRPDIVFLPHPGYNQDHRTVFQAAQVALRPHDKNFFVRKVLVYEGIHDALWSTEPFAAHVIVSIDIQRKIDAYKIQESQVRGMRSPEMLKALARLRGAMGKVDYAEAFQVLRWVES